MTLDAPDPTAFTNRGMPHIAELDNQFQDKAAEGSLPSAPGLTPFQEQAIAHTVKALGNISRSFNGVSDTSVSDDKLPLLLSGDELSAAVRNRFEQAVTATIQFLDQGVDSPETLHTFILGIVARINQGLQDPNQGSVFRTWETEFHVGVPHIEPAFRIFVNEFYDKLQKSDLDSGELAAWVEKRLNLEIHPFSDGCGRTTRVLSTAVLALGEKLYPVFEDRVEFFKYANDPLDTWIAHYTGHIPTTPIT